MFDRIAGKFQEIFKAVRGQARLSEENLSESLREVRLALLDADVNYRVVKKFIEETREEALGRKVLKSLRPGQQFIKIIHDKLVELMTDPEPDLKLDGSPTLIMLVGLQGSGKTTVAGKLARHLKKQGGAPLLVAADIRRPAAREQLKVLGEKAGVETYLEPGNSALTIGRNAIKYARSKGFKEVVLDTAGRLHVDRELMAELRELKEKLEPQEVLLVLDAMTGQDAVKMAGEFEDQVGIDGAVLTKLDGDARGGAAISFRSVTGRPIKMIGTGEKLDDLQLFDAERMVSRILGMGDVVSLVEKAQEVVAESEAEEWEKKWKRASVDLEDFRGQLKQLKKIGSLDSLQGMLPHGTPRLEGAEGGIKRMEAIIDSMTPSERKSPAIIDGSRRLRIARGSGTSIQEVNRLLKQFNLMRKMMSKAGKLQGKNPTRFLYGKMR